MNSNLAAAGRSSAHLRLGRSSFEIPRCSTVTILLQGLDGPDIVGGVMRSAAERYLQKVGGSSARIPATSRKQTSSITAGESDRSLWELGGSEGTAGLLSAFDFSIDGILRRLGGTVDDPPVSVSASQVHAKRKRVHQEIWWWWWWWGLLMIYY